MVTPFDPSPHRPAKRCRNIGAILANGVEVAAVRCELDAGHDQIRCVVTYIHACHLAGYNGADAWACAPIQPTPHRASLEWSDPTAVEAHDPHETFDVHVPFDAEG